MKYLYVMGIILAFFSGFADAQVGINTKDPKGVFHIDGAGDNAASPTPVQLKNDVIVDSNGNVGAGMSVITPKAKLDLAADALYKAFRLVDGSQGAGKVLVGDVNGNVRWGMLKGSGGYKLAISSTQATDCLPSGEYTLSFANGTSAIQVTDDGAYIVMLRITATFFQSVATSYTNGYYRIYKNTVTAANLLDETEIYQSVKHGKKFSAYAALRILNVVKGDKIIVTVKPGVSTQKWTLDLPNTAIIFYKV